MLPNEKFALECRQRYAESGDLIDKDNGVFAHCPVPKCKAGTEGLYLTFEDHQHQGLLQSVDFDECCFFSGDVKYWLNNCDPLPSNWFALWDIYEEFASKQSKEALARVHTEKDEEGRSKNAVKAGIAAQAARTPDQRRQFAMKGAAASHKKKDDQGRSVKSVKAAETTNAIMTAEQKTSRSRKAAATLHKQRWKSTVDGFESTAGAVALHNKARGWDLGARARIS